MLPLPEVMGTDIPEVNRDSNISLEPTNNNPIGYDVY